MDFIHCEYDKSIMKFLNCTIFGDKKVWPGKNLFDPDPVLQIRIRCLFDPLIRDPGWVKSQDPDPE
jgi:hypothetical protein